MKIWRLFCTLWQGGTRKQKEKKKFSFLKCIQKLNVIKKKMGFMYLVSVDPMDRSFIFHLLISFQLLAKWPFAVLDTFVIAPFEIVVFCSKKQTVLDTFIVIRLALLPIWKVHFDTRSAPDPRSFLKCWSNLGSIYILCKDIEVGRLFRKWQFPLALCTENALTYLGG